MLRWEKLGLMLKVEICPLNLNNISEILNLEKECFSTPWSEKIFIDTLNDESSYFIAAGYESRLIGYAGMYVAAKSEGYIYNIAVDKNFRGMGIATKMVNKLINYSKDMNLDFLSLEVRQSHTVAIHLYEKCGFVSCGIRKDFYDLPKENANIMTLHLK